MSDTIYRIDRTPLGTLLEEAAAPGGATLLIPNLQRPFRWEPDAVVRLIDSLMRGWPFGTLLLWKIDSGSTDARVPSRAFWRIDDRTAGAEPTALAHFNPPAMYRMILDGQQRLQSLILAVGGDDFGFKLPDSHWERAVQPGDGPRRGRPHKHWSQGALFLDLPAFTAQYHETENTRFVDYEAVLAWVVADQATGRSKTSPSPSYKFPIPARTDHPGRYVRFSRLWEMAKAGLSTAQRRKAVGELLATYDTSPATRAPDTEALTDLVQRLTEVKSEHASYLELQPYSEAAFGSEDRYTEAVVNIFTRLNKAGLSLTDQEISYAWIKTYWKPELTGGRQADECFDDLRGRLADVGLRVTEADVVRVVTVLWAVMCDGGKLLAKGDLLRGAKVQRLASDLNLRWTRVAGAVEWAAERLKDAGLELGSHFESLNAVIVLMAWRAVAVEWTIRPGLREPDRDAFEQLQQASFRRTAARWFAVTEWAGAWGGGGTSFPAFVADLSRAHGVLAAEPDAATATGRLDALLAGWLTPLVIAAEQHVGTLGVTDRGQVVQYYFPLWLWHRLDPVRWAASAVPLREKTRKQTTYDVDHLSAHKWWDDQMDTLTESDRPALREVANAIGNCWLMEKNFNISRSDRTLAAFLAKLFDFKSGSKAIDGWAAPLLITAPLLDPTAHTRDTVSAAVAARTAAIRDDLKAFVRGERAPVS